MTEIEDRRNHSYKAAVSSTGMLSVQVNDDYSRGNYNEHVVVRRTPVIELNGVYPLSDMRDDQQVSGTGVITNQASEYRVRHQASGDFASLRSANRGRYLPGMSSETGLGIRLGTDPSSFTGDFDIVWGYFDMEVSGETNQETINNGIVWGYDSSGLYVEVIKSGVSQHKTYASNFNIETKEGLDLTDGRMYQTVFNYYGYGLILWRIVDSSPGDTKQTITYVHSWNPTGETSLANSNLQVGGLVKSSNTSEDFSMYIGGRQYGLWGEFMPKTRLTAESVTGVTVGTSGYTPLVSFKRKVSRRDVSVELQSYDIITDNDLITRIVVDGTLNGEVFGTVSGVPVAETSLEVDTSATSYSGGIKVHEALAKGGDSGNRRGFAAVGGLPNSIPDEFVVTFSARAITTEATVNFTGKIREEY